MCSAFIGVLGRGVSSEIHWGALVKGVRKLQAGVGWKEESPVLLKWHHRRFCCYPCWAPISLTPPATGELAFVLCGWAALVFFSFAFVRLTVQVSHLGNRILWLKMITGISRRILNPPAVWVASCNIPSVPVSERVAQKCHLFHLKWTSLGFQRVKFHQMSCMLKPFCCFHL